MRWGVLPVALCACNQVFGLKETSPRDAAFFDSPPRGPAMCPAIGTPPTFATDLHQLDAAQCDRYVASTDTNLAMAACRDGIDEGPIGGALMPSTFLPTTTSSYDDPMLFPEGTSVIVRQIQPGYQFVRYERDPSSGAWTSPVVLSQAASFTSTLGTPSRSPDRRIMYVTYSTATSQYQAQEMVEGAPNSWTAVGVPYTYAELGAGLFNTMNLTADGLRMITLGATAAAPNNYDLLLYAERASLNDRFGPVTVMSAVPAGAYDGFLAADCSRLYFSALSSIYYVQN